MNSRSMLVVQSFILFLLVACSDDETTLFVEENLEARTIQQVFVDDSRETPGSGDIAARPARTLESLVFFPEGRGPFPLLVFSHGLGGTPEGYAPLLEQIAAAGFVIVAPAFPLTNANAPGGLNPGDTQQQPGDVSFLIDRVLAAAATRTPPFAGRIDSDNIGTFGHSNGGITSLGVTANSCCRDARIDAVVVLAGNQSPFNDGEYDFENSPPMLLIHGTADVLVPYEESVRVFNALVNAKGILTLNDVNHGEFLAPGGAGFDSTLASTVDFFETHLKGDVESNTRLEAEEVQSSLAELRYTTTGGTSVTLPIAPPPMNRLVTVQPTEGLANGQVVTVSWENFTVGRVVNILQCSNGGLGGSDVCDFNNAQILQANPTGAGSLPLEIVVGEVGSGRCDTTSTDCVIVVNDAGLQDEGATIRIPISFAP